ncbi:MAG TPA: D-2-hydroxyacid dehydrogenase, partial [Planctomycetota bacterium]|nr:D-2-hydroxyacid dehydrogenase [Planctomycetota bacterium]
DADGFLGKITPPLLSAATRLRWVQSFTASLEHYLFPALVEHPCTLTNMRGIFSDVVADHAIGLVLCFARNLHRYVRLQAEARWAPVGGEQDRPPMAAGPGTPAGFDRAHVHLADATLGVIGLGHIGAEIARRAQAFSMRVLASDPSPRETPPGVELTPLERLLGESDYVVVAAAQTPETAGLLHRGRLRRMKRTAVLVNVGRGAIVPLRDLTEALEAGEIGGAGLDVVETEPLPPDHPLWRRENVILTPHVAAASMRIAERHLETLADNVRRFVEGRPLLNEVDKRRGC